MTAIEPRGARRTLSRISGELRNPLLRNAYALMINSGVTALFGLGFWVIAARFYAAEDVGRGLALLNAMRLLSGLTAFGFTGVLTRFLPETGRMTAKFISRIYLISTAGAIVCTMGFFATLEHWGPNFSRVNGIPAAVIFLVGVVTWSIFTLQDVVLVGLRKATWVPVNNTAVGIAKIGMAIAFAVALSPGGVFMAWVVPVAIAVFPVNLLIFRRVVPNHVRETGHRSPPSIRRIARFTAGDYTGTFFSLANVYVFPVVVAVFVSAGTNAFFGIAFQLATMLNLLAHNMAMSLTVEGAFDPVRLARNCRQAIKRTFALLIPVMVIGLLIAPLLMLVFGGEYAAHGTMALRIMILAALPVAVIELALGVLRAQSRARTIVTVQGTQAALLLGGTIAMLYGTGDINMAALAFLVTQSVIAAFVIKPLVTAMRKSGGLRTRPDHA